MLPTRPARILAAAWLVATIVLGAAAPPASALEPPRPLPGYRPAFATETDQHPMIDCLWASATMFFDKWTNGEVRVSHRDLRALSGDRGGGSNFGHLAVASKRLGLDLAYSPDGGVKLSWTPFLRRLANGAGAIVLGDYSELPRWYGRWDRAFWGNTGEEDNHAIYVERYDARRGRVWIMDPLAPSGWKGEWISVGALRRFAWFQGGYVVAAVTPSAKAAPFAGVRIGEPTVRVSSAALAIDWPLRVPKGWRYPGADVKATFAPAEDPLAAAARMADLLVPTQDFAAPDGPMAAVVKGTLQAAVRLPDAPGAYAAALSVTDRRFGERVATGPEVVAFVPGPRRASMRIHERETTLFAGSTLSVSLTAANTGEASWAELRGADVTADPRVRDTRVIAAWIPITIAPDAEGIVPETPPRKLIELQRLPLVPGRLAWVHADIVVPLLPGRWALVVDVTDDVGGSFAALGSAPAVAVFDVAPPRGIVAVQ